MEDSIEGFSITQNKLAVSISVPQRPSKEMVHGKRSITDLRLGRSPRMHADVDDVA